MILIPIEMSTKKSLKNRIYATIFDRFFGTFLTEISMGNIRRFIAAALALPVLAGCGGGAAEGFGAMGFRELTASQLTTEMGAGWSLGNTLDSIHRAGGAPEQQETAWGNPITTPEMIRLVADSGFNTLRIPVTWEPHIGPAPGYTVDEAWLGRVQEIVDYGFAAGLYVIINMHHEAWHFPSYENYDEAAARMTAVWAQIAERFRGYSEKLIFEDLNEPRMTGTPFEWTGGNAEARDVVNRWNADFVKTIRAGGGHNAGRWLMVPTIAASGDGTALTGFVKPDDDRVIVSIHAYAPYNFALNTNAPDDVRFDLADPLHTMDIDALFKRLDMVFLSKGIPVVLGEIGCINKNNPEARADWARYYTETAKSYGIPCIWWDNGISMAYDGGEGFGLMDRRNLEWWYPEIVEAFISAF